MSSLPAHARSVRMRVMLLACAFVLVSGLGVAYWAWPRQFHGILQVGAGQEARYALSNGTDTNPRRLAGHIGLSMSKDDILALDPSFRSRQLSSSARYDVAELPFAIGLNGVTTIEAAKVTGRLRVTFRNHVREHEARQGTKVQIGKDEGEILEVRPWSGIVSAPGGPAMVQFSWVNPSGEWKSGLVLSDDTCQALDARTAVYFAWRSSREEAMASLRAGMSPLPQARWGVVDGSEVNWIGSLLPGSGVELNDGTSVTLMAVTKEEPGGAPCVAVDIVRGGKTERRKVQVDEADPLIRFEDPAHHSRIFAVYGWAQSRAEVLYLESGAPVATGSIDAGFDWRPAPDGPAIRLDNVLDAAAYAAPGDSALYEAIVRIPGRTIAVCERNAYFLGEARLDFLVDVVPAEFDYALNVTRDGQRQALVLRSGQTTSLDGWKMFIPHSRYATDSAVSFWVTDERSRRALHIGGLMSVLGGAGLFIGAVRRLGRGKRSLPSGRE